MPTDPQNRSIYVPDDEWLAINKQIPPYSNRNTYIRLVLKLFATAPLEVLEMITKKQISIPAYKRRKESEVK